MVTIALTRTIEILCASLQLCLETIGSQTSDKAHWTMPNSLETKTISQKWALVPVYECIWFFSDGGYFTVHMAMEDVFLRGEKTRNVTYLLHTVVKRELTSSPIPGQDNTNEVPLNCI